MGREEQEWKSEVFYNISCATGTDMTAQKLTVVLALCRSSQVLFFHKRQEILFISVPASQATWETVWGVCSCRTLKYIFTALQTPPGEKATCILMLSSNIFFLPEEEENHIFEYTSFGKRGLRCVLCSFCFILCHSLVAEVEVKRLPISTKLQK